jgi:SAM-dependent methyltransferase
VSRFTVEFSTQTGGAADGRLDAPTFQRNHEPIWSVIGPWLSEQSGDAVEIGSGTGQHVVAFAARTPRLTWWPSDIKDGHLRSIEAWRAHTAFANVRAPQRLDLTAPDWQPAGPAGPLAALLCINVVHISPWAVSQHLFAGAGRLLRPGGRLFLYGPFKRGGAHTAPSYAVFDARLRARDPALGVRDLDDLVALGGPAGLTLVEAAPMPANNFTVAFARA